MIRLALPFIMAAFTLPIDIQALMGCAAIAWAAWNLALVALNGGRMPRRAAS